MFRATGCVHDGEPSLQSSPVVAYACEMSVVGSLIQDMCDQNKSISCTHRATLPFGARSIENIPPPPTIRFLKLSVGFTGRAGATSRVRKLIPDMVVLLS
ncbi:hypothetical protein MTO96_023514 [Rhipicephalus appendiculatus]